jgi:hypothetical protein
MFLNNPICIPSTTGLLAAGPLAAAALALWWDGGYSSGSRLAFGIAALAAAVALAAERTSAARFLREPVVLVLLVLGVFGALSALWTLGPVGDTLRWGLVTAGYAAVAVAAATAASRRGGVEALAAGLAVLAIAAAAAGLGAAVTGQAPWAERIAGVWRPGGPLEYPPALALLELSALPVLLAGMTGRSRAAAGAAAVGMALAGGVIALSASRASLAMAVAVAGTTLAFPVLTVRASRATVAAALGVAVAGAAALQIAAGGATPAGDTEVHWTGLVTLIAVTLVAAPLWLALRRVLANRVGGARSVPRPRALAAGVVLAAVLAGSLAYGTAAGRGKGPAGGFLHGRADTWRAAVETFADRPLAGTGADAFLAGSARHQGGQTIVFAHDLPVEFAAELGVVGLLLALALYAATAGLLWRARSTRAAWLLGPAAAAFLVAGLIDWPWHLSGAGAVWSIATGGLAGAASPTAKLCTVCPRHERPGGAAAAPSQPAPLT